MKRWILMAGLAGGVSGWAGEDGVGFNRDIRPILSENCFQCHGFDRNTRKAGLRLDLREEAVADRDGGAAIVPGDPEASEVMRRLLSADPDERMPPPESGKALTDGQRDLVAGWIAGGAEYEPHWAYVAPERPDVPRVAGVEGFPVRNPVDAFVLRRLWEAGVEPGGEADRVTLVRRLSFDLTGLPPEPEVVSDFEADASPTAYEALVERLLRSPHHGERMAVYWLDLVRWADTMGFHSDDERYSTPYRDYVIAAFNSNKPFDEFTREQIAGDLYADPTMERLIASGYNRMNQVTGEGGAQPREYRAKYMSDKTRNLASVWLAATVGCAECHDHKFDPYTTKDFYSLAAFFADLEEPDLVSAGRRTGIFEPAIQVVPGLDDELAAAEAEVSRLRELRGNGGEVDSGEIREAERRLRALRGRARYTVISKRRDTPRMMRVLPRGNWLDESGPVVEPAIPEFLGEVVSGGRADRMDLADWLVSRDNPLTARVFVNRLWYLFFGRGLSGVLDDLGNQGDWPSHPDLLDWLAVEFMDSGWDVRHVIRLILTSSTYRRTSAADAERLAADPDNRWFGRQARIRLGAEFVRDNALAVSGLLDREVGGGSVKPYQPDGYWADSYKSVGTPHVYVQDHGGALYRRGVYVFWKRTFVHPAMLTFDAPNREECTARRPVSNTPLQALVLLNDPTFVEAARVLAQRVLAEGGPGVDSRLDYAFRWVLSRGPEEGEAGVLKALLEKHRADYAAAPEAAAALVGVGEAPLPEGVDAVELAAWTSVARALLNLHECVVRM